MKKRINMICLIPLFLLLFIACEKEGEMVVTPIRAFKPFGINGFVLGDTLEQYFDGVKVRDLYGPIALADEIAFEKNDVIGMELKKKSTGEVVYQQKFNISDAANQVPKFYFGGTAIADRYNYPSPQGAEYLAGFYLDLPKGSPPVDLVVEIVESYLDLTQRPPKVVTLSTYTVPLASNIQPGKWTDYMVINKLPQYTKKKPTSTFRSTVYMMKPGGTEYITGKKEESFIQLAFPAATNTQGKVQSIYYSLEAGTVDLVQMFPR